MTQATTTDAETERDMVLAAIETELIGIQRGLEKEGASVNVEVDSDNATLIVSLERHRIVCEGCLLPEHLVQTMLNKALKAKGLKYKVETQNWLLTEEALTA